VIRGWLEAVDRFQARGWVLDSDDPASHIQLEFLLHDRQIGTAVADMFRPDLVNDGIGKGDHGFIFNFPSPLADDELDEVEARARASNGTRVDLRRLAPPVQPENAAADASAEISESASEAHFPGISVDLEQYPVFVLGAARSGTSAMAGGLLQTQRYLGYGEGHILDLLAHWTERLRRFYALKYDDTLPGRNTMIEHVPMEFMQEGLHHIFIETIRQLFGTGYWLDKTPNSDSIHLAPRFLEIWPNARFIFMRRRALENIASRARKFPEYNFAKNCREWHDAMHAWLSVRDRLQGAAIEVDQLYLALYSDQAAERVSDFLGLDEVESRLLAQVFAHDRPQRTAETLDEVLDLANMGWHESWITEFDRVCQPLMDEYGYTTDTSYHRDGIENGGLVLI
jgi:hypothetical protein